MRGRVHYGLPAVVRLHIQGAGARSGWNEIQGAGARSGWNEVEGGAAAAAPAIDLAGPTAATGRPSLPFPARPRPFAASSSMGIWKSGAAYAS